jgi:hypothetical protein
MGANIKDPSSHLMKIGAKLWGLTDAILASVLPVPQNHIPPKIIQILQIEKADFVLCVPTKIDRPRISKRESIAFHSAGIQLFFKEKG